MDMAWKTRGRAALAAVLFAAVGVAAAEAADGSELMRKVSGVWRGDVGIAVDGEATAMKPVVIDGRSYVPVRELAAAIGYDLYYDAAGKTIGLTARDAGEAAGGGALSQAEAGKFRELAWAQVPEAEKPRVTTKPEEAEVNVVDAATVSLLMQASEEAARRLQELQAGGGAGALVTVAYRTDRDELLGPLVAVFDRKGGLFLGFFIRK